MENPKSEIRNPKSEILEIELLRHDTDPAAGGKTRREPPPFRAVMIYEDYLSAALW